MADQGLATTSNDSRDARTEGWLPLGILGVIVVVGTILRLYRLDEGLWIDEITTYLRYARLPIEEIVTRFDSENQHFLFSILAHYSILLFGDTGWALRLPAVIFGVGSIVALYLVGREVTDLPESILATALLAFSYHQVWFSQNARGYTGLLFWVLISSWFLIRGLRTNRMLDWLGYGIAAALGMYTHLTMGFVIVGQLISYLLRLAGRSRETGRGKWTGFLVGFGSAGLITLLLYLPVLGDIRGAMGRTLTGVAEIWTSPLWTIRELFNGLRIGFSQGAIVLAALAVFVVGAVDYFRTRRIVIELLLFGPVIGAVVTIGLGHPLWPRFFFFAFGFVALVVMRGITSSVRIAGKLLKVPERWTRRLGIAAGVVLVVISAVSIPFAYGPKQDFRGAQAYVEAHRIPGDQVATVNLTVVPYSQYYPTDWIAIDSLDALAQVRNQSQRTWLVYTFPQVLEVTFPDIMAAVGSDFTLQEQFSGTLADGTIYIVLANNPPIGFPEGENIP